jgi:hypothetical protein
MTVNVSKPVVNVREKLAELDKPTGIAGEAMLRAETPQEQFNLIGAGRRNLIINGAMKVAQRGTSGSFSNSANGFQLDRFETSTANMDTWVATVSQVSDGPDGFANSLKLQTTTAEVNVDSNELVYIEYRVEGQDAQPLAYGTSNAKPVTLSFWVKSSITGTYGCGLYQADASRMISHTYTIDAADTWEYKKIVFSGDANGTINDDNGEGLRAVWHLAASSSYTGTNADNWVTYTTGTWANGHEQNDVIETLNATFQITGVQLEVGKVATPFEHRSYGEELALCQRYYEVGRHRSFGYGQHTGGGYCQRNTSIEFKATKRAAPATSQSGGSSIDATSYTDMVLFTFYTASTSDTFFSVNATWTADAEL